MLMDREIIREEKTTEQKEQIRQVKQVKNKNLLSFGDDDEDDDDRMGESSSGKSKSFRIVSFRESQGMGKMLSLFKYYSLVKTNSIKCGHSDDVCISLVLQNSNPRVLQPFKSESWL